MSRKVDIIIVNGFLGSGKTTLLKELLAYEKEVGRKIGILMNELGDVNVDSAVLPSDVPFKEMLNGCICCTIQGELSLQLKNLLEEYELDVIYIEATGAAHPIEIIDACTHPLFAAQVQIRAVITVVNAKQWYEKKLNNKLKKLTIEQVKHADIIVVNKKDQITEESLTEVLAEMEAINKTAVVEMATYSKIAPSLLYKKRTGTIDRGKNEAHVDQHLHLKTVSFSIEEPINRIKLLQWLESKGEEIYRVKGFIKLTEAPGMFLFNFVGGYGSFERYQSNVKPVLVFIGEALKQEKIKETVLSMT